MKTTTLCVVTIGLILGSGCSKKSDVKPTPPKPLVDLTKPIHRAQEAIDISSLRTQETMDVIEEER